jgi:ankyrin repeat protein
VNPFFKRPHSSWFRFLLAQLHLDSIARKHTRVAVRQALEHLPKELSDSYKDVMERIWSQNEEDRELAKQVLGWISYARRPLTVTELQHAVAFEGETTDIDDGALIDVVDIVYVCSGLVTVVEGSNVIRFVHYTAQEYLEQVRNTRLPNMSIGVALKCIKYLAATKERDRKYKLEDWVFRSNEPLLPYAAQYWCVHARFHELQLQYEILNLFSDESRLTSAMIMFSRLQRVAIHHLSPREVRPLTAAVFFSLEATVKCLLVDGADVQHRNANGVTALHYAAICGPAEIIRMLLTNGALISARDSMGCTALHHAAGSGKTKVVEELLVYGAKVDALDRYGIPPLHFAANAGYTVEVQILLKNGADPNDKDSLGRTALHRSSNSRVTEILLDYGAEVDAVDENGQTALHRAMALGADEVAEVLLGKGANASLCDMRGRTPKDIADLTLALWHKI